MIEVPIFHVNGDDPLACMQVSQLALDFRQEFGRDIVIDMLLLPPFRGIMRVTSPHLLSPIFTRRSTSTRRLRSCTSASCSNRAQ